VFGFEYVVEAPLGTTRLDAFGHARFPSQSLFAVGNLMETSALDETVRYAISTRHYLAYATPQGKGRVVAPHAYGITPEGEYTVVCWRFDTGRGPSAPGDWELVRLDEMREPRILDGTFQTPRIGYRRGDKRLRSIFAQL